jgi:hypothetical protein
MLAALPSPSMTLMWVVLPHLLTAVEPERLDKLLAVGG